MKELTKEIIYDFLSYFLNDETDGIWAATDLDSFSFNSNNLGSEGVIGKIGKYEYEVLIGSTKLCFILNGYNKVIKLPLTGAYEYCYEDESSCEDGEYEIYLDSIPNTLELERRIYKMADNNLKKILLPVQYVGKFKSFPVYVQDVAINCDCLNISFPKEVWSRAKELSYSIKYAWYPVKFLAQIINQTKGNPEKFLDSLSWIHDIHADNVGFTFTGKPVIIDYAE